MRLDWRYNNNSIGIVFSNIEEYYETLGYLSKRGRVKIYWHNNQDSGAWAYQGKLEREVSTHNIKPKPLNTSFIKSGDRRLSVTDYVNNLRDAHNFTPLGDLGKDYTVYLEPLNYAGIRSTVPVEHLVDFDRGYSM